MSFAVQRAAFRGRSLSWRAPANDADTPYSEVVLIALLLLALTDADRANLVERVTAYYQITPENPPPPLIAEAYAQLATARNDDELSRALLGVRFYEEAARIAPPDSEVARYAAMLQRMRAIVSDHYKRKFAPGALERALGRELRTLWPKLSYDDARAAMEQQYGGVIVVRGHNAFIAHKIRDESLLVDQYGHRGKVRFVVLDGFVTSDENNQIGGIGSAKVIYRVRPAFVELAARQWEYATNPSKPSEEDTVENTAKRLHRQYLERVLADTKTREAFIARFERDEFHFTMVLHEGRHAIDDVLNVRLQPWEGEYRAKLSQVALSDAAVRMAAADVLAGTKDNSPHGRANARLVRDLDAWMKKNVPNAGGINHFDELSDEQIRTAFRSLDPLAKRRR
jgi:hypothetical protein